jgi:membrane-associated phospholipid phosphatase
MRPLFHELGQNLLGAFKGKYLAWQLVAMLATYIIVASNLDWFYFEKSRSEILRMAIFPAIALGGVIPVFGLPLLLLFAKLKKRRSLELATFALGQAAILGWIVSSTYKAFTGRIPPVLGDVAGGVNSSHGFQFGFFEGGIFWGWPSSHTTVAFAMAGALAAMYPENKFLKYAGFIYAAYIGFGVSVSIHWLSEAVAGVIFGTVIGFVVGRSFRVYKRGA